MSGDTSKEIRFTGLKEVSHIQMHLPESGKEGPGTAVTFHCELLDADGKQLGSTVEGFALVYLDPADQRVKQRVTGTDEFEDGSVYWSGIVDLESIIKGEPQITRAFGISGRYRGKIGTRSLTIVGREDATTTVFTTEIALQD
ncbi:hypothetical protein ACFZB9_16335 [Kitasatospora sp. NPDC008050]|uniref:allene oxide cyclase barrel-like domain-containing protein n=1 Tax=Kitasatospora sp. NPDC008050 TaxID=3364021 RepID=UPI0036EC7BDE